MWEWLQLQVGCAIFGNQLGRMVKSGIKIYARIKPTKKTTGVCVCSCMLGIIDSVVVVVDCFVVSCFNIIHYVLCYIIIIMYYYNYALGL